MLVKVTQEYIDKGRVLVKSTEIEGFISEKCPIALALLDTFKVEYAQVTPYTLIVGSFPENLVFQIECPFEVTCFVNDFDSGKNVFPFEFELSLEGVKL